VFLVSGNLTMTLMNLMGTDHISADDNGECFVRDLQQAVPPANR